MVHRRSKAKRIKQGFLRFVYQVTHEDDELEEAVCTEEITVPAYEIIEEDTSYGRFEYKKDITVTCEQGEITRDSRGRGSLQTVKVVNE